MRVLHSGQVYAVAGGFPLTASAEMLVEGSLVWTYLSPLPLPVKWTSGLAFNNMFYVLGQIIPYLTLVNQISLLGGYDEEGVVQ